MKRLRSSYYALAGLLLLVAASNSCTSVNDRLDDYQARLNRVLDEQTTAQSVTRVPRRPVQHNRLALPQADINLLELLRLDQCRIGLTVAQKNSSLGRVALPSQQLLMELELLTHGSAGAAASVRHDAGAFTRRMNYAATTSNSRKQNSLVALLLRSCQLAGHCGCRLASCST